MLRLLYLLPFLLLASGCAGIPSTQDDIARAFAMADQQDQLTLLRTQGEIIAGRPFIGGNKVDLLRDGAAAYPAMLTAIQNAHKRIDMESYTFDGGEGEKFASALLKRRRAGVEINVIYDSWGSSEAPPDYFDRMRQGGIHVVEYNPIDPTSIVDASANDRDHRKLLLIDGKIAFTGGVNISEVYKLKMRLKRYFHVDENDVDINKLPWRDTQVRIEGPVVTEFETVFMQTWKHQKGPPIPNPPPAPPNPRGTMQVQAIDGTPGLGRYTIYRSLMVAITLAHKSIHMTTGFFVPPPDLADALQKAARRGVDVTLILPGESTSDFAVQAGRAYYEDLMESGVKIYERQDAILHAKTAVIDNVWSTVGSSNLDWRSILFNNECNAVILGDVFGQQMEGVFRDDMTQSQWIDPEKWRQRPFLEMLDEWKARVVEPLL
jgi:cardiolipin synthase